MIMKMIINKCLRKSPFVFMLMFTIFSISPETYGSGESSAAAQGLSGAYSMFSEGIESITFNPANMALDTTHIFTTMFLSGGLVLGNNAYSISTYNEICGAYLTESMKNELLADMGGGALKLFAESEVGVFGFTYDQYGFLAAVRAVSGITLPQAPMELILMGNEPSKVYSLDDLSGGGMVVSELIASGAHGFKIKNRHVAASASLKFLLGHAYSEIKEGSTGSLTTLMDEGVATGIALNAEGATRTSLGGTGMALDVSGALNYSNQWKFGLSICNLFSGLNWNRSTEEHFYSVQDTVYPGDSGGDDLNDQDREIEIGSFSTGYPGLIRVGVAYFHSRKLRASGELTAGFGHPSWLRSPVRLSAGAEYFPASICPLRAGLSIGSVYGFGWTVGTGVKISAYSFDISAGNMGGFFSGAKGLVVSFSNKLYF